MTDQRARAKQITREICSGLGTVNLSAAAKDILIQHIECALADERRRALEEAATMAKEKAERTLSSQHLDIPGYKYGYRGGLLGLTDEIRAKAHAGQEG